jgi:hypothetical protein
MLLIIQVMYNYLASLVMCNVLLSHEVGRHEALWLVKPFVFLFSIINIFFIDHLSKHVASSTPVVRIVASCLSARSLDFMCDCPL